MPCEDQNQKNPETPRPPAASEPWSSPYAQQVRSRQPANAGASGSEQASDAVAEVTGMAAQLWQKAVIRIITMIAVRVGY